MPVDNLWITLLLTTTKSSLALSWQSLKNSSARKARYSRELTCLAVWVSLSYYFAPRERCYFLATAKYEARLDLVVVSGNVIHSYPRDIGYASA